MISSLFTCGGPGDGDSAESSGDDDLPLVSSQVSPGETDRCDDLPDDPPGGGSCDPEIKGHATSLNTSPKGVRARLHSNVQSPESLRNYAGLIGAGFAVIGVGLFYWGLMHQEVSVRMIHGETMGTYYQVSYVLSSDGDGLADQDQGEIPGDSPGDSGSSDPDPASEGDEKVINDQLKAKIDGLLGQLNSELSTYIPSSKIMALNAHPGTGPFEVSETLMSVLSIAQDIHQLSGGAFDPTLGPLIDLWGFGSGSSAQPSQVPMDDQISAALKEVGFGGWQLGERDSSPPSYLRVFKSSPGAQVNLSAIAKGYGVDLLGEILQEHGINNYLVDIGGEVRARGEKAPGLSWNVGVVDPLGTSQVLRRVALSDESLATSGTYFNFFEVAGRRYSHILDPRTGRPIEHHTVSVSVSDPLCAVADAWATALLVLGSAEGMALAQKQNLAVMFVDSSAALGPQDPASAKLEILISERWQELYSL